jgi:hypothetical protein
MVFGHATSARPVAHLALCVTEEFQSLDSVARLSFGRHAAQRHHFRPSGMVLELQNNAVISLSLCTGRIHA